MKPLTFILLLLLPLTLTAQDTHSTDASQEVVTISVVPFETISDKTNDRLGKSISESLSSALSQLSGIKLYERAQLERITGELQMGIEKADLFEPSSIQQVGQIVRIDYMVMGSLTRVGSKISINIRTTEVLSGKNIFSTRIEGDYDDIFDLSDELAFHLIDALKINMSDMEKRRIEEQRPPDLEAFEIYNLALSETDINTKIATLEEAYMKDPGFLLVCHYLADSYIQQNNYAKAMDMYSHIVNQKPDDYKALYNLAIIYFDLYEIEKAKEAFERCLIFQPEDCDAIYNLGLLYEMSPDGNRHGPGSDINAASGCYQLVLQINPNYPNALYAQGIIFISQAQRETDPALQRDLLSKAITHLEGYLKVLPEAFNAAEVEANVKMFRELVVQLTERLS